jgi:hypothetical protein
LFPGGFPPPLPFGAADCDTPTLLPAMVSVALRAPPVVLATVTVAVPEPVRPLPTVAQDCDEEVVHAQLELVVTVTVAVPPVDAKLSDVGETL